MHRVLFLIFACLLLSAGCLTADTPPQAEDRGVRLITPPEGFAIFGGQGTYTGIIGAETPNIRVNYSLGLVAIPAGNATFPHRLIGSAECVHVIAGAAEIRCDNSTVVAREGETVLLPEGVLQSIAAAGDRELRYIDAVSPPFAAANEVSGEGLAALTVTTACVPVVIPDPRQGIEWDLGSEMMIGSSLLCVGSQDIFI